MGSRYLRLALEFRFGEGARWYADKTLAGKLVDLVLLSELAPLFAYAGEEYEEAPAKDAAAIRQALVTGEAGIFAATDELEIDASPCHFQFHPSDDSLLFALRVGGAALESRTATVLDTLDAIASAAIHELRNSAGLRSGKIYLGDDESPLVYPRPRPPVTAQFGPMTQLVLYLDVRFHNDSRHLGTKPEIVNALAAAAPPPGVQRSERDQVVTMRWIDSLADRAVLGRAMGQFEQWLSQLIPVRPAPGYNALGDREDRPSERATRPPFTFFDPKRNIAYKAIMVGPDGDVDEDLWAEQLEALKTDSSKKLQVRLIVPLRDLALGLRARARSVGFNAVLYPDDTGHLWNPDPPGEWLEDIKSTPT